MTRHRPPHLLTVLCATLLASPFSEAAGPVQVGFQPDIRLSGDQPYTRAVVQREPSTAASLSNPLNVVAFYKDVLSSSPGHSAVRVGYTLDGGATWSLGPFAPLRTTPAASGDPAVVSDADGSFLFAYLDSTIGQFGFITDISLDVARSTDGGRSFASFSIAVKGDLARNVFPDKPYIAVDTGPKSRFRGNIYVSYGGDFSEGGYTIHVVASRDGGRAWSKPVRVSRVASFDTDDIILGSIPVVAPDGTAYVFYTDGNERTGPTSIRFVKSADGGKSWSLPADAAATVPTVPDFVLKNADPQFGTREEIGIIGNSFPAAAIAPDGTIYLAWNDFLDGHCVDLSTGGFVRPSCFNADVRLSVSRNGGQSWSPPVKVTDESGDTDQFFPWIATHPDGLLSLMWLDRRLDPENIDYNVFYTNTRDGMTFLANLRASSATSIVGTGSGNYIGDYNGIAGTGDAVHLVWADVRDRNNVEVFVVRGNLLP